MPQATLLIWNISSQARSQHPLSGVFCYTFYMRHGEKIFIDEYPVLRAYYENGLLLHSYYELRLFLIEKYGVCYWCSRKVKDYPQVEGDKYRDDLGTIDHLISRKTRKKGETVGKVLACYKCNHERGWKQDKGKLP